MEENRKNIEDELNEEITEDVKTETEVKAEVKTEAEDDSRYKMLVRLEDNLWSYGSPIIFEKSVLVRDTISLRNLLSLNFTNLDQRIIKEVYVTVYAGDSDGNVEQIEHVYSALHQKYLTEKGSHAKIHILNEDADNFVIKIDGVKFEDGSYWQKEDAVCESAGSMDDIEAFAIAKAKDYEDNYISGTEAVAKDDSGNIGNGIEILKRITWYKNVSELITDAMRKYEAAKKNEERKQAREDRLNKRKKAIRKRYITVACILVVLVAGALAAVTFFFVPNQKYNEAKADIDKKEYIDAAEKFENLNGFLKSEEYLAQSYYNLALESLGKSDEKKAAEYFSISYEADKESQYGVMAKAYLDYYDGVKALDAKDYDNALKYFKASTGAASDVNLINKASVGMAQINHIQKSYESAWNAIKNVYAKDASCEKQYAEYGYDYAKSLLDEGKIEEGIKIYSKIAKLTDKEDLYTGVYTEAVKLGEAGKIEESMNLLKKIKKNYSKADKLYKNMSEFTEKSKLWLGDWIHHGKVNGEKKVFTITISQLLYKGEMCLKVKDMNNKYLGFDTVISKKNNVSQIVVGTYQIEFRLKKNHNQKFTFSLKEGGKMERALRYNKKTYRTNYKRKK